MTRSSLVAFLQPTSTSPVLSFNSKTVPFSSSSLDETTLSQIPSFKSSSSIFLSASEQQEATTAIATSTSKTFEAVAPDTNILIGFGIVFILSIIAAYVWSEQVVPVSRTKLALSKRDGEVKQYLDELRASSTNSTDSTIIKPNVGDGRDVERWLVSDWLNDNKSSGGKRGRQKEPALPILKKAKWNSGDNPVVVTAAIMMIGILVASVTERIGTTGSF